MAVSPALRRLLRVLDLEEEQRRLALESALGELRRLEHARAATMERERRGRLLVTASVHSGEMPDRLAGLEEMCAARRLQAILAPRIAAMETRVAELRGQFLGKRIERRQAETLLREAEARTAVQAGRRAQRSLDDWYLNLLSRTKTSSQNPSKQGGELGPQKENAKDETRA